MSFESGILGFVERMLKFGRRREAGKRPEKIDHDKVDKLDQAIGEVRQQRADALDRDIARKQDERSKIDFE